ncbi:hypothetical protein Tco_0952347 [Tanacetum coccineum]|uniref:Integrase, catalytic region, zinc finger, CCHC-type, peptidase aspartic, catalytic n=1 Tax=Tanacetum coccineum TaxID=301880 RepID=A0ABQ5DWT0_9ASTR
MDEFDKFTAKEGDSLESMYERLTTLVNIIDRNNVRPIPVSINTKFLNCLQPKWSKYVTMVHHNQIRDTVSYDQLYDSLVQFEPHSHASPSYSHSPQPYYVTHPSSVVDYEEDYQGELQGDSQKDKLTTAMMLLARAITQKFLTPTNNRLCTSSNTRNQAVIEDGRVYIQTKNAGYSRNGNRNARRQNKNQSFNVGNGNDETMKDEARSNLNDEENDFMLDNSYGDETLEELTAAVIMIARIQPADDNVVKEPTYDAKAVSKLKKQRELLQKELETCKERAKTFMSKTIQCSKYKETCDELKREIRADKDTIERILKEKDKIENEFFKVENEKIIIQHETQLAKKAFKEQEN